jgi:hypothetical protein
MFFFANFLYHQMVFRHNNNKLQFAGFLLGNLFTSYSLAEASNANVAFYYAALYNNTEEMNHRARMSSILRLKMHNQFK